MMRVGKLSAKRIGGAPDRSAQCWRALRRVVERGKFASVRDGSGAFGETQRISTRAPLGEGERRIRERGQSFSQRLFILATVLFIIPVVAAACGGGNQNASPPTTTVQGSTSGGSTSDGSAGTASVAAGGQTGENQPFDLVVKGQAVPPDFQAAYEGEFPIVVQFYQQGQKSFYPQGLGVDSVVDKSIGQLQKQHPNVKFFSYDIDDPGAAQDSSKLQPGQYGTLATQLGVSMTPYVAMLAPRGGNYVYESVFVGYVTQPVLEQALSDLANTKTQGANEKAKLVLKQVETVASPGALRSVTVGNEGNSSVDLGGYKLTAVNPSTGEASPDSKSLTIDGEVPVKAGESVSLGRSPNVKDTKGDQVEGTFGGGPLILAPGDQVALVDPDGAVAATFTL